VLKTLNADIANARTRLAQAEVALKQAQAERNRFSLRSIDEEMARAQTENRESIFQPQLHSLAAMIFGVDPRNVTPRQLKTLESYLIFVSSIAAAFSSTLIAMTAVRRIKTPKNQTIANVPDEAMAYLFGPLVSAIGQEAKAAVAAAVTSAPSDRSEGAPRTATS
jgi:hypothetical protein